MVAYRCGGSAILFGEHFTKSGPFETVARELLLRETLEQLGEMSKLRSPVA